KRRSAAGNRPDCGDRKVEVFEITEANRALHRRKSPEENDLASLGKINKTPRPDHEWGRPAFSIRYTEFGAGRSGLSRQLQRGRGDMRCPAWMLLALTATQIPASARQDPPATDPEG